MTDVRSDWQWKYSDWNMLRKPIKMKAGNFRPLRIIACP
jgi:hypothetical protein